MAELLVPRQVSLTATSPLFRSARIPLDPLVAEITLRLRRPTTVRPLAWGPEAGVRVRLVVVVDGTEQSCTGEFTGGIRMQAGAEMPESSLRFVPTTGLGEKGRAFIRISVPDAEGYYNNVPLSRVGEGAALVEAYLEVQLMRGAAAALDVLGAVTVSLPAPVIRYKNSVVFDAASAVQALLGTGVLSVTHTSTGADRGVFMGVEWDNANTGTGSTSITYGGTASTEMWDVVYSGFNQHAGYQLAGQATGAQTVTSTLVATGPNDHHLGVISMTGVHQTTPVGTAVTASGTTGVPITVTVASVGADDMVVDNVGVRDTTAPVVGADQTYRNSLVNVDKYFRQSTQPGSAGGVMSHTNTTSDFWGTGAVAFKPVALVVSDGEDLRFLLVPMLAPSVVSVWA